MRAQDRSVEPSIESLEAAATWPSVTVVVPTHHRPTLLRSAVQRIMDQRYPGQIETIIVFDKEAPARPDVVVPEGRALRLMTNERTPGPAGAYNTGALAANGEYLAFCNDDDEWLLDKLRLQIQLLQEHPDAFLVASGIYLGDANAPTRNRVRVASKDELTMDDLLRSARTELHMSAMLCRRDITLRDVGLIDENIPGSYGEDYDWLLRAVAIRPMIVVRRPLVRVRFEHSYFAQQWATIVEALTYQLDHRPELKRDRGNLARIYGRLAFAHAAMGHRREARSWARRSFKVDRRQPRVYLAYLVSLGLVSPRTILRFANLMGRGI
jgi:glycosyltransferase involved in cell wall biosynthesis